MIVDGPDGNLAGWQTPHGSPVEIWAVTLDEFRSHGLPGSATAWNRPAFLRARVDLDRLDGEIERLVERKRRLEPGEASAVADDALDGRVRPFNKWLRFELESEPLGGPDLMALVDDAERILAHPTPRVVRSAFRRIEVAARATGLDAIVDSWEPDVARLRGEARYRQGASPRPSRNA